MYINSYKIWRWELFLLYFKIFKDIFNFNPEIINIDFSQSLYNAIKLKSLFDKNIKVISCFFHYSQSIVSKMKNLKIINQNLSKKGFTILLNIQILSFLKPELFKKYIDFLEDNLNEEKEINLFKYFKKY